MLRSIGISLKRYTQRNPGPSPSQSGVRGDAGTFSGVGIWLHPRCVLQAHPVMCLSKHLPLEA
ncbi:hypothetical protein ACRRTK_017314 [Alexandromys fortis]